MTKEVTAVCRRGRNTLFTLWVRSNLGGGGSCLVPCPVPHPFKGLGIHCRHLPGVVLTLKNGDFVSLPVTEGILPIYKKKKKVSLHPQGMNYVPPKIQEKCLFFVIIKKKYYKSSLKD